jgi:hypothetical protein
VSHSKALEKADVIFSKKKAKINRAIDAAAEEVVQNPHNIYANNLLN